MKRITLVSMMFLLCASVCFAASIPSEEDTRSKVNQAKDALEEAESAVYDNETDYSIFFERCPDVLDAWNDAVDTLESADDLYDEAFEDFILGNYNESYVSAQHSIESSNEVVEIIEEIPQKINLCQVRERREAASYSLSLATNKKNNVKDIVTPKLSCPGVQENWTKGNEKLTLANTHYTGGSYTDAKEAADMAVVYYDAAEAAAIACVPPAIIEETEIECEVDMHCGNDEVCSEGLCVPVVCECGYVSNHLCHPYECCDDRDCPSGQICVSHVCTVQEQPPVTRPPAPAEEEEGPLDYGCSFPAVLLLALLGAVCRK